MKFGLRLVVCAVAINTAPVNARVYMVDNAEQLVAAVIASNQSAEADLIDMAPGLYVLDQRNSQAHSGLPPISGDLHIRGNGSELRRYEERDYELLRITDTGRLNLDRITLAEGSAGALTNHGNLILRHVRIVDHSTADRGDAVISNHGNLTLSDSVIGYNLVDAANGQATVLLNYGTLSLKDTQFVDNRLSTRHPEAHIACALINQGRAELLRVSVSGCMAEQLDMSTLPNVVVNTENAALLVEGLSATAVELQPYALPMTAATQ